MTKNNFKSIRVSSNMTLILALFIPTFWIVFFGLLTIAFLFSDVYSLPFPGVPFIRWIILGFFLLFLALIYFTIMRLKRVELSESHVFMSNYFKTYQYAFGDIESLKTIDFMLFEIIMIKLKYKGKFGTRIPFILNKAQMNYYLETLGKSTINEILE